MPKVIYGFSKGERLDFRNVREYDRPDSPYVFPDVINGEPVHLVITWHGFLVYDISVDIGMAMVKFMRYMANEGCCGRCLPGKNGTAELADKLESLRTNPNFEDLAATLELAKTIKQTSKCSFAPSSVSIVISFLQEFPDQLNKNIGSPKVNYYYHQSAPCAAACPANVPIPEFIDDIRSKNFTAALKVIRSNLPLAGLCGRICPHPCEAVCRRGDIDSPINIMNLKQAPWNYEYDKQDGFITPDKAAPNGKKCGIVGAGPAGLTAAYYLALKGYEVDIFDKLDVSGGMAAIGIPNYREPKDLLEHEINLVKSLGVKIHHGKELGMDLTLEYLSANYDAILLAIGAWATQDAGIEEAAGVESIAKSGIDYLQDVASGKSVTQGDHVVIIGGGNTAIDCARTAIRLGSKATIVYRRTEVEMPAIKQEVEEAKEEGVEVMILAAPTKAVSKDGKLLGVECVKMKLGSPDASGRRSPEVIPFSNFVINCSYLIPAIGQRPDIKYIKGFDIKTTRWDTIDATPVNCQTNIPKIFAAGDCLTGPDTVVRSVGSARWASKMMDRYIRTGKIFLTPKEVMELSLYDNKIFQYGEEKEDYPKADRQITAKMDIKKRTSTFEQVELPFTDKMVMEEARRCIRCMRLGMVATGIKPNLVQVD